jgi:hypothetical protein
VGVHVVDGVPEPTCSVEHVNPYLSNVAFCTAATKPRVVAGAADRGA